MTYDKNLSTCKKICLRMKDKQLSFIRRQIFLHVDKFFYTWTNFFTLGQTFLHLSHICPYETTMKDKNFPILHEKARQMKKTFCFNFCAYHCLWKNVSTSDLSCPQLPRLKKGNLGNISQPRPVHFSASAYGLGLKNQASALKNLSSVSFFILW